MASRNVGMRGVVKVDVLCRKCNKVLENLRCIIERNPGKAKNGIVRFTSTSVNCCNLRTHVAVTNLAVEFDMKNEFDYVEVCSLSIKIYNVTDAPANHVHSKLGLPVNMFHHEEGYTISNGVFKQSYLDIESPVHIKLMMVSYKKFNLKILVF